MLNAEDQNVAGRPGRRSQGPAWHLQRATGGLALWQCLFAAIVIAELCSRQPEIEACVFGAKSGAPGARELCERAWQHTRDEAAAVSGALVALRSADSNTLRRWARRAAPTLEGARILHFWGQHQLEIGDFEGAKAALRGALAIRVDRDPQRATNTAYQLIQLARSIQPAEETIDLMKVLWQQATRGQRPLPRAFAASVLVDYLIDLGELNAAGAVLRDMDGVASHALKDIAEGTLRAAQNRPGLALTLFERAATFNPGDPGSALPLNAWIRTTQALLDLGRIHDARSALNRALDSTKQLGGAAADLLSRLAAVEAEVLLSEGQIDTALARVEAALAMSSRDAASVQLLTVRGDALARRGDITAAEQSWRAAADMVETWRASIPSSELRGGLLAHHRHALEAWLESTAERGDIAGALEVTRRLVGRGLLDRLRQRDADTRSSQDRAPGSPASTTARGTANATIDNLFLRLSAQRDLVATLATMPDLAQAPHDMVAIMSGSRATWAIRRRDRHWSIDRVGDRSTILALVDAFRRDIDDGAAAAQLGAALFPPNTLPTNGAPLVVLVDREYADVTLAGLQTGGRYLVEHAPILELLAPDLLFARIPERAWSPPVVLGDPVGDLGSAAAEAEAVARGLGVEPKRGASATRDVLANGISARVMHIGAHSTSGNGEAALVLSDGPFTALDIVRRRIAPRLAVIATCRSQVDDNPATSLVAAFLAAGTAGVIGTKRSLGDSEGAELLREFYAAGGARDPMRALAAAQRSAIAQHRRPHAWATVSFFGVGDWITNQE